jgi:hypothetical protein
MIRKADTLQVLQSQRPENSAINARAKRQAELATNFNRFIFLWQIINNNHILYQITDISTPCI